MRTNYCLIVITRINPPVSNFIFSSYLRLDMEKLRSIISNQRNKITFVLPITCFFSVLVTFADVNSVAHFRSLMKTAICYLLNNRELIRVGIFSLSCRPNYFRFSPKIDFISVHKIDAKNLLSIVTDCPCKYFRCVESTKIISDYFWRLSGNATLSVRREGYFDVCALRAFPTSHHSFKIGDLLCKVPQIQATRLQVNR